MTISKNHLDRFMIISFFKYFSQYIVGHSILSIVGDTFWKQKGVGDICPLSFCFVLILEPPYNSLFGDLVCWLNRFLGHILEKSRIRNVFLIAQGSFWRI